MIDSLEEVDIHQNGINSEGIIALSSAFKCNPNLKMINLSDNTFNETGAKAVAEVIYSKFYFFMFFLKRDDSNGKSIKQRK